ncbi:hypothetical protein [Mycobacterium sp. URHB0021]
MTCSGILGKTAVAVGAVAVPVVFAVAGAGHASANPGWCISGPFGYASACLDVPVWGGWNQWDGGWRNGWYGGDDDWEGGDD